MCFFANLIMPSIFVSISVVVILLFMDQIFLLLCISNIFHCTLNIAYSNTQILYWCFFFFLSGLLEISLRVPRLKKRLVLSSLQCRARLTLFLWYELSGFSCELPRCLTRFLLSAFLELANHFVQTLVFHSQLPCSCFFL